ncbi:MAG: YckD family protein [Peptococcaceae bacterium]|nr:YckD family protein [Peptococcaceae bacterium]
MKEDVHPVFKKRRFVGILVAALILALAVTGVALAMPNLQANPEKANLFQDFIAKFAANLGVDQDKVVEALEAAKKQMLDEAVQQGRMTQEQADKIAAAAKDNPGWFGSFFGKKHGGKPGFKEGGRFSDEMAEALGLTPEQLKSELQSGKKLQQIITDQGLTEEQFRQKMFELKKEAIAEKVSEGKLTQEQADKMIQRMEQRLSSPAPGTGN